MADGDTRRGPCQLPGMTFRDLLLLICAALLVGSGMFWVETSDVVGALRAVFRGEPILLPSDGGAAVRLGPSGDVHGATRRWIAIWCARPPFRDWSGDWFAPPKLMLSGRPRSVVA